MIYCIGVLFEKGKKQKFSHAHVDVPAMIAAAAKQAGVSRFVHVSALGVDQATSKYAKSKLAGEEAVLADFPNATILRPSVIFGVSVYCFVKIIRFIGSNI